MESLVRRLVALFALACLYAAPAFAQTFDYSIYVDGDRNAGTGCSITLPNGSFSGVETRYTVTVTEGGPPAVTQVTRSTCSGGVFGAGVAQGTGAISPGAGTGGGAAIELSDALTQIIPAASPTAQVYVVAQSGSGDDVLLTTSGAAGGGPILILAAQASLVPAPLIGIPALLIVVAAIVLIGSRAARRRLLKPMLLGMVMLAGVAGATIYPWSGTAPIATDPAGDTTSGQTEIDLRALYFASSGGNGYFRIDVAGNLTLAPAAANDSYTASVNTPLTVAAPGVLANDTVNGATITAHSSPAHGTLTLAANGGFTYTPATNYGGTDSFTYTLSNPGGSATATVSISVVAAPGAVNDSYTTTIGSPFSVAAPGVMSNDAPGVPAATLTSFGGGSLGGAVTDHAAGSSAAFAGGTLTVNGDGSLSLTGATTAGTYTFGYRLTNTQGTSDATVSIQINQAPSITSGTTAAFVLNTAGSFTITTTGTPTVTSITLTGCTLPTGLTFSYTSGASATISGTATTSSSATCMVTASNGIAPDATQTLTVAVSNAPVANNDSYSTMTGTALNVAASGVLGNDQLGTPTATLTSFGGGSTGGSVTSNAPGAGVALAGGTLTLNANGSLTLSAPTTAGTYTFLYRLTNSQGTSDATVTIQVNQAPTITSSATATFVAGTSSTFNITTTGTPTVSSITLTGCTLPAGLSFAASGGSATISGSASAGGVFNCTVTATNGIAPAATQSLTVTVNQAPSAVADSQTFALGNDLTITATNGLLANDSVGYPAATVASFGGDSLGGSVTDHAAGTSVALAGGTLTVNGDGSYSLTSATQSGQFTFQYEIDNGIGSSTALVTIDIQAGPAITSANTTSFTIGQAGTFTVTTSGFPTGATMVITESGALPGGITFVDNHDGTATLSGTPAAGSAGPHTLTLTAHNGIGTDATQTFTLVINAAPTITSAASTTFTVGTGGSFTVTFTGTPTPTITETGALPSGVTLSGAGVLSGTPAAGSGGSYPITIKASNGVNPDATQSFTLTVNEAPTITSANTATFTVGTAATFTISTTGFPHPTISETGALPGGILFTDNGNGTATLSGTAQSGSGGAYPLTIGASNGVGTAASQSFTLTVNQAPAITSAGTTTFTVGTPGSFQVTTTGTPTPTVTETGALPGGVTLTSGGLLSGTPAAGSGGSYPITLSASNGIGSPATQSFVLVVNQAPKITSANATTFPIGQAGSFTVNTTGYPRNPGMTISQTPNPDSLPSGVSFTNNNDGTATIAGTPGPGTARAYSITLGASNGVPPADSQAFTLTVTCPVITLTPATGSFNANYLAAFSQAFSAGGGTAPYSYAVGGTPPPGVTFSGASLTGSPTNTGAFGFTVQATDANGCTSPTQSYTLTVKPVVGNDTYPEPVTGNVSVNSANVFAGAYATTTNDSFPGGATISAFDATSVNGGTVSMTTSGANLGQFTYNPPAGFIGSDSFTYTVSSNGQTATATVTLTVANMFWFVDANAASAGDGRLSSPFKTLAAFQAINDGGTNHAQDNHTIFVAENATAYAANLTLRAGQKLVGQDSTVDLKTVSGITPAASSAALPAMNATNATTTQITSTANTLTLATNNTLRGLTLSTTGAGSAVLGTTFGGLKVDEVKVTASGASCVAAVNLQAGSAQNINANFTSVSATSCGNGIAITNTTGSFTVTGVAATGAVTSTILCGAGADNAVAGNGVYMGTVAGVSLTNMAITSCPNFAVRGIGVAGFQLIGSTINGVNGNNASTTLTPDNFGEGSVAFYGLTGSALIKNSNISGGYTDNVRVVNPAGSAALNRLTLDTVTIGTNDTANGNAGLLVEPMGSTTINLTVTNSTFTASRGDLFHLNLVNNGASDLVFTNNALSNNHPAIATGGGGVTIGGGDSGTTTGVTLTYDIENNTMHDANGAAVLMFKSTAPGNYSGTFNNNTIGVQAVNGSGSAAGDGLKLQNAGQGAVHANITNNHIYEYSNYGIDLLTGGGATAQGGTLSVNITGNTISTPNPAVAATFPFDGIQLNAGTVPGDTYAVCANIGGAGALQNVVTGTGNATLGSGEIRLRQRQNTTVNLPGYGGATGDTAAIVAFLEARDVTSGGTTGAQATVASNGFTGTGTTCP